jgi:hypothetical protein
MYILRTVYRVDHGQARIWRLPLAALNSCTSSSWRLHVTTCSTYSYMNSYIHPHTGSPHCHTLMAEEYNPLVSRHEMLSMRPHWQLVLEEHRTPSHVHPATESAHIRMNKQEILTHSGLITSSSFVVISLQTLPISFTPCERHRNTHNLMVDSPI